MNNLGNITGNSWRRTLDSQDGRALRLLIADLFARANQAERMASGIKRIMKFVAEAEPPTPIIKSDLFFEIIFTRDPKFKVGPSSDASDTSLENGFTSRQIEILEVLKGKKLAPDEIINRLSKQVSPRTLRRDLQALNEQDLIDAEGAKGWARRWFLKK